MVEIHELLIPSWVCARVATALLEILFSRSRHRLSPFPTVRGSRLHAGRSVVEHNIEVVSNHQQEYQHHYNRIT
jgi:hypothetical protein